MKYELTLSEKQCKILCQALDLFSRIHALQVEEVAAILRWHYAIKGTNGQTVPIENLNRFQDVLLDCKESFLNCHRNGNLGMGPQLCEEARAAYDIQQVVRHELWKNSPEERQFKYSVDASEPMKYSKYPLPEMKKI